MMRIRILLILTLYLFVFSFRVAGQELVYESTRSREVEPYIAINPLDTSNIIGVAISIHNEWKIRAFYSFDIGDNWDVVENYFEPSDDVADPMVAFDPAGIAYLLYQDRGAGKLYLRDF